ncbi:MAG: hypothetical protein ACYC35_20765 [Pirellulales bacterium]
METLDTTQCTVFRPSIKPLLPARHLGPGCSQLPLFQLATQVGEFGGGLAGRLAAFLAHGGTSLENRTQRQAEPAILPQPMAAGQACEGEIAAPTCPRIRERKENLGTVLMYHWQKQEPKQQEGAHDTDAHPQMEVLVRKSWAEAIIEVYRQGEQPSEHAKYPAIRSHFDRNPICSCRPGSPNRADLDPTPLPRGRSHTARPFQPIFYLFGTPVFNEAPHG